jgi:signal peptidase II
MKRALHVALIAVAVIVLDQYTKYLIVTRLSPFDSIEVFPFLHIVNIRNTGAAFGMFRELGSGFFILISLVAIAFVIYLILQKAYSITGLSLILGGAIGNLIDRIQNGQVVDFIDVFVGNFHWPAFNVADSALTVGVFLIVITSLFRK